MACLYLTIWCQVESLRMSPHRAGETFGVKKKLCVKFKISVFLKGEKTKKFISETKKGYLHWILLVLLILEVE